jgi:gamma-glutamylaminecyclotransferase
MKIFVYGTLMKGFGNNRLLEHSEFVGKAITKNKYTMRERGIPFVNEHKETSKIYGEVYNVDKPTLRALDSLEGHPRWYYRKEIDLELEDGESIKAEIYFNEESNCDIVRSGDYRKNFSSIENTIVY